MGADILSYLSVTNGTSLLKWAFVLDSTPRRCGPDRRWDMFLFAMFNPLLGACGAFIARFVTCSYRSTRDLFGKKVGLEAGF